MSSIALPLISMGASLFGGLFGKSKEEKAAEQAAAAQRAAAGGVWDMFHRGQEDANNQFHTGVDALTNSTNSANSTLSGVFNGQAQNLEPYLTAGSTGVNALREFTDSTLGQAKPTFAFDPSHIAEDPGYQFQLAQGQQAIGNSAAARGGAVGGNVLQDLTKFGQGTAATYLNDYFTRQKSTFDTNQAAQQQDFSQKRGVLGDLTSVGEFGTKEYNAAAQDSGDRIAQNTVNAGNLQFTGGNDLQKFLAGLGVQAGTAAGNFTVGAGADKAAGTIGGVNSLLGGINGAVNDLPALLAALGIGKGSSPAPWGAGPNQVP